jgi:hypothetical protein
MTATGSKDEMNNYIVLGVLGTGRLRTWMDGQYSYSMELVHIISIFPSRN